MSKLIEDRIGNWLAPDQWRVASTTSMAEAYSLLREAESELRRLRAALEMAEKYIVTSPWHEGIRSTLLTVQDALRGPNEDSP